MNRRWLLVLTLALVAVAALGCSSGTAEETTTTATSADGSSSTTAAPAETVTLKVVSAWAEGNTMNAALEMLQDTVAEKSGGRLTIEWGGGPEAIPPMQLAEALRSGVVDIAWTAHSYNVSQIPVLEGAKFSTLTPWEERDAGVTDFYQGLYTEKMNAHYLGAGTPGLTYNLYTTEPISTLADFKGKSIRVTPAYKAFVEALGAAPVTTDPGEVYTALERNMVVGYGWPSVGISDFGWDGVTKFVIEPAFYQVDVIALVADDKWAQLPEDLQQILTESMQDVEHQATDFFASLKTEDRAAIATVGVEETQLSSSEAEAYLATAREAGWNAVLAKEPDLGAQLRDMIDK
ncbi:MAG: TRAP transporter substrate-binding protein DctP [Thermoleophilia bacterium]